MQLPYLDKYEERGTLSAGALLQPRVHLFSAFAEKTCDLFYLSADAFKTAIAFYPHAQEGVRQAIAQRQEAIEADVTKMKENVPASRKMREMSEQIGADAGKEDGSGGVLLPDNPRRVPWSLPLLAVALAGAA